MRVFTCIPLLIGLSLIVPSYAQGWNVGKGDWMSSSEAKSLERKLRSEGKMFSVIRCRKNGRKSEFKVNIGSNRRGSDWTWHYGSSILSKNLKLSKNGYKQVAAASNDYKGRIRCAVWKK